MMEYGIRGGVPIKAIETGRSQLDKYFVNGEPTGARLFQGYPESLDNVIVKFGKREHLEAMRMDGTVRVTPASFYSQGSLLKAMQDLETEREFHISAVEAVLAGRTHATTKSGYRGKVEDGFVKQPVHCPDYVLWCACRDIDRRMPDDFGANAALIVRRPDLFAERFDQKIKSLWPGTKTSSGPVQYYDPCSFVHRNSKPVRLKHFSFAYQGNGGSVRFHRPTKCPPIQLSSNSATFQI